MRRGQAVSIDFMAAMVVFIVMVISGFYFLQTSIIPGQGFSSQIQQAGENAWLNFQDETEWTVKNRPVIIRSGYSLDNEPVEVNVPFPGATVENSILVMGEVGEVRSQHSLSSNETVFIADVRDGSTTFDVVWTEDVNLDDRNYSSDLEKGGNSVWHGSLNLTFTSSGLSQLEFSGTDLLQSEADLGAGSSPSFDIGLLKANVTYSSGRKHIRLYEDSGQVRVTEFFTGEREWVLNLTSSFDTLYTGKDGVTSIDTGGTGIYTATVDWVDFNDSSQGLSIIGDDIFVNVSRETSNSRVEARVNFSDSSGRKELLLYPHSGDYMNAEVQKNEFYDPYSLTVGVEESTEGTSRERSADLESEDIETVRDRLELGQLSYNVSVPGVFEKGEKVDTDTTVVVLQFPVPVVERFGNISVETMKLRVWD